MADATTDGSKIMTEPEVAEVTEAAAVGAAPDPVVPAAAAPVTPVAAPSSASGNPILNWLLVRNELAQARDAAGRFTPEQHEYLRRARVSFELGELALAPGNAVRSGSTAPLAANLFRQSVYWALLAQRPKGSKISPEELWAETDRALLGTVAGNESELAYLTAAVRSTFIELADGTAESQQAAAMQLRRAASRLVTSAQSVLWRLEWAKLKRLMRLGAAAILLLIPIVAIIALWPAKVDLAKGKFWHTSSSALECHPNISECGGVTTDILFHTKLEQNPWFEYDLGAPLTFSSLTIRNRSDYGPERAVPLVVEVSNDDKSFKEVARRTDSFTTWSPSFTPQHARYVRLRVARESMLHLEWVKVHP